MTASQQDAGVATSGHPRTTRRPVELTPTPRRCVCGVDRETSSCPANCPTRSEDSR